MESNQATGSRKVKVLFRQKKHSRFGTYHVFTNLRLPDERNPRQLALCYIPDRRMLSEYDKDKIETALRSKWPLPGGSAVFVDWEDAQCKWAKRGTKRPPIDRDAVWRELIAWLGGGKGGGKKGEKGAGETLMAIRKLGSTLLAWRVGNGKPLFDPLELDDWWNYEEVPRLFLCYKRYTERHDHDASGKPVGGAPEGFLNYLTLNIRKNYSTVDFVRKKRATPAYVVFSDIDALQAPELEGHYDVESLDEDDAFEDRF